MDTSTWKFSNQIVQKPILGRDGDDMFSIISKYFVAFYNGAIIKDTPFYWLIDIPADFVATLGFSISASVSHAVTLYEQSAVSSNGTEINVIDNNRITGGTSVVKLYHTPTISATGTERIVITPIASEPNLKRRMILKPDTKYIIKIVPTANGNVSAFFDFIQEVY